MSVGFIKIHRALFDNWVADEPEALAVWLRLLSEANFKDKKKKFNGALIEVKRGQLIFGLDAFSKRSGVSVRKLRRIIDDLESDGMIDRQKTNRYSLITVLSYNDYQDVSGQSQANDNPTSSQGHADVTQTAAPKECKKETSEENTTVKPPAIRVPYQKILDEYHEILPELSRVDIYTDKRKSKVKTIYMNSELHRADDYYLRYFQYVRESKFLMGQTEKPFNCNFEWLMNINNMAKVIEGNYHRNA